jgi:hypothetical protein
MIIEILLYFMLFLRVLFYTCLLLLIVYAIDKTLNYKNK